MKLVVFIVLFIALVANLIATTQSARVFTKTYSSSGDCQGTPSAVTANPECEVTGDSSSTKRSCTVSGDSITETVTTYSTTDCSGDTGSNSTVSYTTGCRTGGSSEYVCADDVPLDGYAAQATYSDTSCEGRITSYTYLPTVCYDVSSSTSQRYSCDSDMKLTLHSFTSTDCGGTEVTTDPSKSATCFSSGYKITACEGESGAGQATVAVLAVAACVMAFFAF